MKTAAFLFLFVPACLSQTGNVADYLGVPGPLEFNGTTFHLAWSANPNQNYFKQEYLPSGQTLAEFRDMMLLEAVSGSISVSEASSMKINELKERKSFDPNVNYDIIRNESTGEIIVDFIMSDNNVIEWNAYRYSSLSNVSGIEGVYLMAISRRAYGNDINEFLVKLKEQRPGDIEALSKMTLPGPGF